MPAHGKNYINIWFTTVSYTADRLLDSPITCMFSETII